MRTTATRSGTTSGRRRAARTSAIAVWRCGQLSLLRHARRLFRVARRARRERAVAQGGRALQPAVLHDVGPDDGRHHIIVRHGQRSRFARLPDVVRSGNGRAAVAVLHGADEPRRSGLETWKSLDAARHGGGHPWLPGVYDPSRISTSSAPAIRRPPTRRCRAATAWRISSPARSSR